MQNETPALSQKTLYRLFETAISLSAEQNIDTLLEKIVLTARELCHADGGTLYLIDEENKRLKFSILQNDTLHTQMGGTSGNDINFPPLYLYDPETGEPNYKNVATYCVLADEIVNIDDAYSTDKFDFSGTKKFDQSSGYHSQSFLALPLRTHSGKTIAVLQLLNAQVPETGDVVPFTKESEVVLEALGSYAAVAIDNQMMADAQRSLLESFLAVLAQTIDEKSLSLGGHCQRVPVIARMLAFAADGDETVFKDFSMDEDDWYAFHLASWLHDCGKITIPTYIEEKSARLETVYNRIHEIRQRFEILRRDAHIEYLKKRLAGKTSSEVLLNEFSIRVKKLKDDFDFIARCNLSELPLKDADRDRLEKISKQTYHRYFDKKAGISQGELNKMGENLPPDENPKEALLEDSPEMMTEEYNRGEVYSLAAPGIRTLEEETRLERHVETTVNMLQSISFPKSMSKIVEYACAHHEKVDGTGYPYGLTREEMSVPARILAIADYFEKISSATRSDQKVRNLRDIIAEMSERAKDGTIDPDLFNLFLTSKVYQEYAEQYMDISQIDYVPIEEYLVK